MNDVVGTQHKEIIYLASGVENKEKLDQMVTQYCEDLAHRAIIINEFETLDSDNNRLDVITKNLN